MPIAHFRLRLPVPLTLSSELSVNSLPIDPWGNMQGGSMNHQLVSLLSEENVVS